MTNINGPSRNDHGEEEDYPPPGTAEEGCFTTPAAPQRRYCANCWRMACICPSKPQRRQEADPVVRLTNPTINAQELLEQAAAEIEGRIVQVVLKDAVLHRKLPGHGDWFVGQNGTSVLQRLFEGDKAVGAELVAQMHQPTAQFGTKEALDMAKRRGRYVAMAPAMYRLLLRAASVIQDEYAGVPDEENPHAMLLSRVASVAAYLCTGEAAP